MYIIHTLTTGELAVLTTDELIVACVEAFKTGLVAVRTIGLVMGNPGCVDLSGSVTVCIGSEDICARLMKRTGSVAEPAAVTTFLTADPAALPLPPEGMMTIFWLSGINGFDGGMIFIGDVPTFDCVTTIVTVPSL